MLKDFSLKTLWLCSGIICTICLLILFSQVAVLAGEVTTDKGEYSDVYSLLTPHEKEWLSQHHTIRVAGPMAFPPFSYYEDGNLKGMAGDYLSFVFDMLDVTVEIQPDIPWPEVLNGARERNIDLISCAAKTIDRQAYLSFTDPYLSFPLVIITKTDAPFMAGFQDLSGQKVAFVKGTAAVEWIAREKISLFSHFVDTPLDALQAVSFGRAHAYIDNLATATYLIQKNGLSNLKVAASISPENYHLYMAIRKDWPQLVSITNKILGSMSSRQHMEIQKRWLAVKSDVGFSKPMVIKWFLGLLSIAALFIGTMLLWNRRLKREVRKRDHAEKALMRSQDKLKEHNEMLSSIFETAAEGICVCVPIDEYPFVRFSQWNKKMEELTGYTLEEINRLGWYQSLYPDENLRKKAIARMDAMREGQNLNNEEWEIVTRDGSKKPMSISTSILTSHDNKTFVLAIMHDIADRKQYESQLIASRKEWEDIFNAIGHPAMILDKNHRIENANLATLKLTGLSRNQIKGEACHKIFHGSHEPSGECPMKALLNNGEFETVEMHMETLDGHYLVSCTPILDEKGQLDRVIHISTDITEKIKLEHQLRQSHKMEAVGTLSGGIAHEFNNILGIILGNIELAMDDIPDWNPTRGFLSEIRKATLRGRDVVRQLLSFSRKTTHRKSPLDMVNCVQEAMKLLRVSIPTQIEFKENLSPRCHTIMADQTQMQQMVINLCNNAAHAMEDGGGVLEIGLRNTTVSKRQIFLDQVLEPGEYIELSVADTGHGIPEHVMEHLFDPFFTTKAVDKGTGMGLAVVHGIVHGHDGFIKVETRMGKGTAFLIYFPVTNALVNEPDEVNDIVPGGNESILFVDDESALVSMGKQRLERLGYQVEGATVPETALEMFRARPGKFDLVITDMAMPRMTGAQLIEGLIEIRPDVKTLLCTGYSKKMDEKTAFELGATGFAMKPMDQKKLAEMVRKVLDTSEPAHNVSVT
ncbi:PAS domain S-box-containing protein [Desulfocicer vacuolatum DSM 3385]|uniref:histidine kinase n=1 Tax=Desulfocicer vacuolatum DSM 3385 TaxID=1121400 RepID=A0A1W2EBA6_9BACT|nr:transporter substrate-binding domain-containing protein [Desulfocicer vacuolatum]SMD07033.1 PAS domain S-box-containing protein [Desulfocicer vacuolatum DSM 3385]